MEHVHAEMLGLLPSGRLLQETVRGPHGRIDIRTYVTVSLDTVNTATIYLLFRIEL